MPTTYEAVLQARIKQLEEQLARAEDFGDPDYRRTFRTQAIAERIAARAAQANPGTRFYVFPIFGSYCVSSRDEDRQYICTNSFYVTP